MNYSNNIKEESKLCAIRNPIALNWEGDDGQPKNCIAIPENLTEEKVIFYQENYNKDKI